MQRDSLLDARNGGGFRAHGDFLLAIAQMMGMPTSQLGTSSNAYDDIFV